jgi:hypothetical protein
VVPLVDWTTNTVANPTFVFPTIYAGLGAPFDTYTVQVQGLGYPWSRASWSMTYAGQPAASPTTYVASGARFASPGAGATTPLTYNGVFHLDGSVLASNETATSWELLVTQTGPAPVGTGGVPLP